MTASEPAPRVQSTLVNGIEISWAEWGDNASPTLLLVHGMGFHGRCWDQLARLLHSFRIVAIDLRGHGRSGKSLPVSWDQFGSDLANFIVRLDLRAVVAAGHSFGGHCVIQAAARLPDRFERVVVIDPVVLAPQAYTATQSDNHRVQRISRRRNVWESPQRMVKALRDRASFSSWRLDVLKDYCEFGLVRVGDHYELACEPSFEASVYKGTMEFDIYDVIAHVSTPVTVVRAKSNRVAGARKNFLSSPTWPGLAEAFQDGQDIYLPENSHFIPMEDPGLIAAIIQPS